MTFLVIYYSSFGRYTGFVSVDGIQVCRIDGCKSVSEAESVATAMGYKLNKVEMLFSAIPTSTIQINGSL